MSTELAKLLQKRARENIPHCINLASLIYLYARTLIKIFIVLNQDDLEYILNLFQIHSMPI